jgi:hypothetical protein
MAVARCALLVPSPSRFAAATRAPTAMQWRLYEVSGGIIGFVFAPAFRDPQPQGGHGATGPASALMTDYWIFTSIALGLAWADLGRLRFSMPSLKTALILASSTLSGNVKLRMKLP